MSKSALTWTSKAFHLTALSTALVLAGCGGGGSSVDSIVPAPDLGVVPTPSDDQAESSNNNYALYMTSSVPELMLNRGTTVKVSVRAVDGKTYGVVADKEVKFSITDPALTGVFNQSAGVVKTDKQGIATITLEVVNTLTPEQKQHLKDKGLTITASLGNGQATLNLKGTDKKVTAEKNSVYDLYITTSKPKLKTGTDTMIVTVNVRNKDGGIESGVPVNFSIIDPVKYGITLAGKSSQITDEKGQIQIQIEQSSTTTLSRLDHETKLVITVDDTKNAVETTSLPIEVVGTKILGISSNQNVISDKDRANITGRLIDGSDRSIANTEVALMNKNKQIATVKTDSNGQFTFSEITNAQLTKKDDSYIFDIVANPKGESQSFNEAIKLAAVVETGISIPRVSDIKVGDIEQITVLVPDAPDGDKVTLTTTKGRFTNAAGSQYFDSSHTAKISNGKAIFKIQSFAPGPFSLTATYKDKKQSKNLSFVSVEPDKLLLQAKNIQMTTNSSTEVKVRVLDAQGGAVKNAIVNFSVVEDSSGGHIDQAIVKTDENGIGVIAYTSGNNPTANEGVRIQAKVNAVELPDGKVNTVSVGPAEVKLTVQTTASSIGVGLADKISDDESKVYYFRNGSAFVTNNSGQPAANQLITISLKPKTYIKGQFKVFVDKKQEKIWVQERQECANEDRNFNGILDVGEDGNNNGQLEPGYKASILSKNLVSNSTSNNGVYNLITNENGRVDFRIRYLKEYANWFTMDITVATLVDGSEASQSRGVHFPILTDDQDLSLGTRPNKISPFGIEHDCASTR